MLRPYIWLTQKENAMNPNLSILEQAKVVVGLPPRTPSTSTPDYVSMKGYSRCAVLIVVDNATTVTGSAITLKQAQAVAGTGEKALALPTAHRNIDTDAADALAAFDVTSDTFTTDATNAKNLLYVADVKAEDLDVDNGFDCIRAGAGDATAAVLAILYILYGARYTVDGQASPSAILD